MTLKMASLDQTDTVIVAVDGSEHSENAFDYYLKYLHRPSNAVVLLHSPELSNLTMRMSRKDPAPYKEWDDMWADEEKRVERLRTKFEEKLTQHNIKGTFINQPSNNAGDTIVERAQKDGAILVVLGTRGLGTLRRTLLGSVSEYVMHHSHCPVFVYKHESDNAQSFID